MTMYDDNNTRRRTGTHDTGFGWGIPLAIVAAILIIGGLFFMNSDGSRTTASNDRPAATSNTGPAPSGAPVPGPTSTTPAPNR